MRVCGSVGSGRVDARAHREWGEPIGSFELEAELARACRRLHGAAVHRSRRAAAPQLGWYRRRSGEESGAIASGTEPTRGRGAKWGRWVRGRLSLRGLLSRVQGQREWSSALASHLAERERESGRCGRGHAWDVGRTAAAAAAPTAGGARAMAQARGRHHQPAAAEGRLVAAPTTANRDASARGGGASGAGDGAS